MCNAETKIRYLKLLPNNVDNVATEPQINNRITDTFTIVHQNMQCIRNKIEQLEAIFLENKIDIFCVTEHWLHPQEPLNIDGYTVVSRFSRTIKGKGGVAILSKNTIDCNEVTDIQKYIIEGVFECVGTTVSLSNDINLVILTVYRIPNSNFESFIYNFNMTMDSLSKKFHKYKFIIVGDFNIDFLDPRTNHYKTLTDSFLTFNINFTIKDPTRVTKYSSTCIDNICTDLNSSCFKTGLLNLCVSDHYGQYMSINSNNSLSKLTLNTTRVRSTAPHNLEELNYLLSKESWNSITDVESKANGYCKTDELWADFINTLKYHINVSCPFKSIKLKNKYSPWLTKGIMKSSITLKHLYNLSKLNNFEPALTNHYKLYKSTYRKVIKLAKKLYYCGKISTSSNKSKTMWSIINKETKNIENRNTIKEISHNGLTITDPQSIANNFNDYFTSIPDKLISTLEPSNCSELFNFKSLDNSFFFEPVCISELFNIIRDLKNTNSSGFDDISTKIIKSCLPYIIFPLQHLINLSFKEGKFPEVLKTSVIKPVYKKGNKNNMDNYRPIALLSIFSKMLEKCLVNRMYRFFHKFKVLSPHQFGFRKDCSTSDAITSFIDITSKNMDQKQYTLALFADLKKAFDCVDLDILLAKLEKLGIRGPILRWIASFLCNRPQVVQIDNIFSECRILNRSVPQGSVGGPLYYLIYVNDFPACVTEGHVIKFADDTNCIYSDSAVDGLINKVNSSLLNIKTWFTNNKLVLNLNKTVFMCFNKNIETINYIKEHINFNFDHVDNSKFLGVVIDNKLNWKNHIHTISAKLAKACFCIKRLKQLTNTSTCRVLYFSNFYSIMAYGIVCWGMASDSERIFVLQKRAIRLMCGKPPRTPCRELFKSHKILPFPCVYILESLLLAYKNKNKNQYYHLNSHHNYDTRNGHKLLIPIHHTKLYTKSPYLMGITLFNHLPKYCLELGNLKLFKREIKTLLLEQCFYSVQEYLEFSI